MTTANTNMNSPQNWTQQEEEEDTIDLAEIFYLLWNHIGKIILWLFVGAVVTFGFTFFFVTPLYKATARMYILSSSSDSVVDLSDLQVSNNLRADYAELMTNRPLLQDVINNLGLSMDYTELSDMISISNPTDTRIINITVTSPDPQQAADIANELANQAKIYLPDIMKTQEPSVFESAIVPNQKSSPSYSKNTVIGGLVAALIYCIYLIVKYLSNDTLVTPDDVYKYLGVQPLATIPEGNLGSFNRSAHRSSQKKKKAKKGNKK